MIDPGLMFLTAATLPLLASLMLICLRRWNRTWTAWIAITALFGSFVLSTIGSWQFQQHIQQAKDSLQPVQPWSASITWLSLSRLGYDGMGKLGFSNDAPAVELRWGFHVDALTSVLFPFIALVALCVHLHALRSMRKELKADLFDPLAHVHRPGRYTSFFMHLSFFSGAMLHLVLADNLLQIFICWELVGLASYFLIGFYREQEAARIGSLKAFIMNRVGDAGFLIGIVILITYTGTLSLITVKEEVRDILGNVVMEDGQPQWRIAQLSLSDALRTPIKDSHDEAFADKGAEAGLMCRVNHVTTRTGRKKLELAEQGTHVVVWNQETLNGHYDKPDRRRFDAYDPFRIGGHGKGLRTMPYVALIFAGLGLLLGCIGKSAQFPLQTWLPDAMAGPAPVSALVHSATMVAAGVYLLARIFPLLLPELLLTVAYGGVFTAFYGATCALVQTDVKRILAYSTLSQLGLMFASLGVGGWIMALLHLATHACCKAMLFLGTGSVIDSCNGNQDISRLGGLRRKMPWLAALMLFACLSLIGLPLLPGWYSKDGILVSLLSFASLNMNHLLLIAVPLLTTMFTAAYLTRFWWLIFMGQPRNEAISTSAQDVSGLLRWPLFALALLSLVLVWLPVPLAMENNWLIKLWQLSEPSAVREEGVLPLAAAAEQLANNYFKSESWLRPVYEATSLSPHWLAMILALLTMVTGVVLAWNRCRQVAKPWPLSTSSFQRFFYNGWHWDTCIERLITRPFLRLGHLYQIMDRWFWDEIVHSFARLARGIAWIEKQFDEQVVDGIVRQSAAVTQSGGRTLRAVQTGSLRTYVMIAMAAAIVLSSIIVIWTVAMK